MSQIQNITLFMALVWVLILTPGPDLFFVLSKGIAQGKKAGLLSALGITLGIMAHTLMAAVGLSEILRTSAMAFTLVKILGACYLIYIGVKMIGSKPSPIPNKVVQVPHGKIMLQGFLSNTLNPKVALFFLAFIPQFIDSGAGEVSPFPFLILGSLFALSSMLFLLILGYFSGSMGHYLETKRRTMAWTTKISGCLMVLLGIKLVCTHPS
ncbi:LysE family translocator [Allomuricauda sp. NBRC 101325]|uniref:LysE family translocator n=1 Tax=Allomuricauda sp. NBRC 101325 TaxID=1113758 RepID=UPI0025558DDD|nr:LysE family translocator [Muricauda sp. NBRC 101325]